MNVPFPSSIGMFRSERFDLRKLHYFARIVEIGSISRASSALHVAQPALSKSIRLLEFDLRAPLLERSNQGVRPTRAGEKLYEHCKIIFRQLELARAEIQGNGDVPRGCVTIGIPYSVNLILAAPLLRETLLRFPEIDLRIVEDHSIGIGLHLASSRLDVGIMVADGDRNPLIVAEDLVEEELLLIRSRNDDDQAAPATVLLEDMVDRRVILPKGQLRTMVEDGFARHSVRLGPIREMETFSMIPQCVEAGIGDAILPGGWISAIGGTRTSRRRFAGGMMSRLLTLCHAVTRPQSQAALCVTQLVRQIAAELINSQQWQGAHLAARTRLGQPDDTRRRQDSETANVREPRVA